MYIILYLLLDYPFAYCHDDIKQYINTAVFIDTPLVLRLQEVFCVT